MTAIELEKQRVTSFPWSGPVVNVRGRAAVITQSRTCAGGLDRVGRVIAESTARRRLHNDSSDDAQGADKASVAVSQLPLDRINFSALPCVNGRRVVDGCYIPAEGITWFYLVWAGDSDHISGIVVARQLCSVLSDRGSVGWHRDRRNGRTRSSVRNICTCVRSRLIEQKDWRTNASRALA